MIIAIDGPAGSGKGTVAKLIANKFNLVYVDTGATYRALSLKALRNNIKVSDKEALIELSKDIDIKLTSDGKTYLDGEDVSTEIRSKEVTEIVSPVSSIPEVRENLVKIQRSIASSNDAIMEGRDITTVVLPNADIKIYLDASVEERANRRYKECLEKNIPMTYEEVIENIKARDYNDMHKEVGSLIRTDEQIYIDTTNMTIDEVVDKISSIIKE
jgi:cytidylate kinase